MARYTLPPATARLNRSRGGSTFTRNATQFIIRTRRVPTLKRTRKSSRAYSMFGALSTQYRSLTSGNRTQWTAEAPNYPRTNSLGDGYTFSGLNMQIGSNANLRNNGQSQLAQPASGSTPTGLTITSTTSQLSASLLQVVASTPIVPAGERYALYASRPVTQMPASPSIRDCKLLYTVGEGGSTTANIYGNYIAAYPGIQWINGQVIYFTFRKLDLNTGQWSDMNFAQGDPIF